MIKIYLSYYSSNEQQQLNPTKTKINLSLRTIRSGTPQMQLNLRSIQNSSYDIQYTTSQLSKSSKPAEHNKLQQDNTPSIRGFNQYDLDLLKTQGDDTFKFQSTSQNEKNLQLKRWIGDKSCSSYEKIRVFDRFNQNQRLNTQPITSNTYITTKKTSSRVDMQSKNQLKISPNNVNFQDINNTFRVYLLSHQFIVDQMHQRISSKV
ncbi:unnamed protein product [Paramecium octaurelia]|uniref:Uncharacterized protein n=1 Tax=Paramecium octaurelia TaxID=43137 RepID=A0A8S1YC71_PAROT|nr:unnamed protein product [Paramecium octaurelia]